MTNAPGSLQGSGMCWKARKVIANSDSTHSAMVAPRDRMVADTITGARIISENGFSSPPVR